MTEHCRDCIAFDVNPEDDSEGICRKHPPGTHVIVADGDDGEPTRVIVSAFPQVKADLDWCCEFQPEHPFIS